MNPPPCRVLRIPRSLSCLLLVALFFVPLAAMATWSNDPAANLSIADGPGEQVLPKLALTSDGGCYLGWFDNGAGGYQVRLQRLDRWGNELWPHNGVLVSSHPQSTSLVDWDVDADAADHAVLVFSDTRAGDDLDIYAYRIAPDGTFVWGPDGITLSDNTLYEPGGQCAPLPDGTTVFVWARIPDSGAGAIVMQRIAPDGTLLFGPGLDIPGDPPQERPAFCNVVPADAGNYVVSWIRDIRTYTSPRHLRAQKFNANGDAMWGAAPVSVYDAFSLPIGYFPMTLPDEAGGAILGWHVSTGNYYDSLVQHMSSAGIQMFGHNGASVSTQANIHHIEPAIAYRPASSEIFVFFQTRNANQSQWGINAQKMTAAGARAWTDNGVMLLPMNTTYKGQPRCGVVQDGAVGLFFEEPGAMMQDRILAFRVNSAGSSVWGASPVVVSSTLSSKSRLPVETRADGVTIAAWEDGRTGTPDVYGQNVNPDGSLGMSPQDVPAGLPNAASPLHCAPNPLVRWTEIPIDGGTSGANAQVLVSDVHGRIVRRLSASVDARSIRWDGLDASGTPVPAGRYYCRMAQEGRKAATGAITVAR